MRLILALLLTVPCAHSAQITVGAFGDFGTATQSERDVADLVKSWNVDAVISLGDETYVANVGTNIDLAVGQFWSGYIYPAVSRYTNPVPATVNRFWSTLGNHAWLDMGSGETLVAYTNYWRNHPSGRTRYYSHTNGPVLFVHLSSDPREPNGATSNSVQATWASNVITSATQAWKVVICHHPPYVSNTDKQTASMRWPFKEWGADMVWSGHAHLYERITNSSGLFWVVGTGGAALHSFSLLPATGSQVRYRKDYGAMKATFTETNATMKFHNRRSTLLDSLTLTK